MWSVVNTTPWPFYSPELSNTPCIGVSVGRKASVEDTENSLLTALDSRTFQTIQGRHTD